MILELDFFGDIVRVTRRKGDHALETQSFVLTEAGDLWLDHGKNARLADLLAHLTISLAGVSAIHISGVNKGVFSQDGVSVSVNYE